MINDAEAIKLPNRTTRRKYMDKVTNTVKEGNERDVIKSPTPFLQDGSSPPICDFTTGDE